MVKYVGALLLVMAFVTPVFAQDDYPQMELTFGYGNLGIKDLPGRHSGFATHQTFNLTSRFAIENYLGWYKFGSDPTTVGKIELITEMFGGRFNLRTAGPVFYGTAGLGAGVLRFPQIGAGTNSSLALKLGGGVDIPINDSFAWKVDVSRMSFHFNGNWTSGANISTGIILKIHGGF